MSLSVRPSRDEFRRLAGESNLIPVHAEILADMATPIGAYLSVVGDRPGFLLESVEGGETVGRYSFIGLDPWEIIQTKGVDPLKEVERLLSRFRVAKDPDLPRFIGGAVGFLGFDTLGYFEPCLGPRLFATDRRASPFPEAAFLIAGKLVVFDNLKRRVRVIVHADLAGGKIDAAYDLAVAEVDRLIKALRSPRPATETSDASVIAGEPATGSSTTETASNMTREEFIDAVRKAKEYIAAGDVFQVVLSQRFHRSCAAKPFDVYRALRAINPSPYLYYLKFPGEQDGGKGFSVAGSSPEVMVRVEDGKITLRPIAGTRPRGANAAEDEANEADLLADAKELAEHIMLVDLGRNDVGRVSAPGTVRVDELMTIERYSHVMHIVSNVTGGLADGKTAYDVIRACFPAGTVSGAPKIRATEIITELEPDARGPYAGAVGYIGFDGNADTAIVLRTVLLEHGSAHVQAGAGIVHDSVPENEYEETKNKARAMLKALEWAEESL